MDENKSGFPTQDVSGMGTESCPQDDTLAAHDVVIVDGNPIRNLKDPQEHNEMPLLEPEEFEKVHPSDHSRH